MMGNCPEPPENRCGHKHILEDFLNAYLVRRDAEKTISLVTEDIYSLGTGIQEVARNKSEFQKLIYDEFEQIPSPIEYTLDSYQEKMIAPEAFTCICAVTIRVSLKDQTPFCNSMRLTAGFRKVGQTFLAYHLHMSEPSREQEEHEFLPLHYGARESGKLDAVKQFGLIELMKKMLPGGAMGGYVEPGFPLYFINDELLEWLGYTYDEFIEENGQAMSNTMHPDDVANVEATINEAFASGDEYTVEYRMRKKDGSYIWVRDIGRKTVAENGRTAMISIIADISAERRRQHSFEKTIEAMKQERRKIDRMTGLLTREPAEVLIEQHLIREKAGAFFLMDIDNFKLVNDTKGHPAGDQLLHDFSALLLHVFPQCSVTARFGGDEFVVFVPEFKDTRQLTGYAKRILADSEQLAGDELLDRRLGISIGISVAPDHGSTLAELYANADKGLYYAKHNGKNRYSFYDQGKPFPETGEESLTIHTLCRMIQGLLVDKGAFMVEYDAFNKICQFAMRNSKRLQQATEIALFTLHAAPDVPQTDAHLRACKSSLEQAIRYGLRIGDLMMDFSNNQIAVMLVNCSAENAEQVARRITASYQVSAADTSITVTYELSGIDEDINV